MSGYNPYYNTHWVNPGEDIIKNVCDRFKSDLSNRRWNILQEIDQWRNNLVSQIEKHVRDQKKLLEEEYQRQTAEIDKKRRQYLDTVRQQDYKNNNERIDQLVTDCKSLKFELGASHYAERPTLFIEFLTEEQVARKKLDESNGGKRNDNTPQNNPNKDFQNFTGNNADGRGSSFGQQASAIPIQIERSKTGATGQVSTDHRHSSNNTRDQNSSLAKCPTCYMIFPRNMPTHDRNQHVEDHYKD